MPAWCFPLPFSHTGNITRKNVLETMFPNSGQRVSRIVEQRGYGSSGFEHLEKGGSFNFQFSHGGWVTLFHNKNRHKLKKNELFLK